MSLEEVAEKREIIRKSVERLYSRTEASQEEENHMDTEENHNYDSQLRPELHKFNKEIRLSKKTTVGTNSVRRGKSSTVSNHCKFQKVSNSLQSYHFTEDCNTEEAETLVTNENEDRYIRKDYISKKDRR